LSDVAIIKLNNISSYLAPKGIGVQVSSLAPTDT
jgi:hypothetical protein